MRLPIFQVDAFTDRLFSGNPAAVILMDDFPTEATLQALATENNLAETAFLVPSGGDYRIRWFTPAIEVPLCGHATLASAAVVMERIEPGRSVVTFSSASGPLPVRREEEFYALDFPARPSNPGTAPAALAAALGIEAVEVFINEFNYMVVLDDEQAVRALRPDMTGVARLDRPGVIVTAPGRDRFDFVSRYFAPAKGIPEDPVTGGAHCMLVPYWAQRLGRSELRAFQASPRGGEMACRLLGNRVELKGKCVFYLEGSIML